MVVLPIHILLFIQVNQHWETNTKEECLSIPFTCITICKGFLICMEQIVIEVTYLGEEHHKRCTRVLSSNRESGCYTGIPWKWESLVLKKHFFFRTYSHRKTESLKKESFYFLWYSRALTTWQRMACIFS